MDMVGKRMIPTGNPKQTFFIIAFGATMMVVIDLFVLGGWRHVWPNFDRQYDLREEQAEVERVEDRVHALVVEKFSAPPVEPEFVAIEPPEEDKVQPLPAWQANAVPFVKPDWAKGLVVVIIDDLGLNKKRTARTVDLPAPLTLAYLPYARGLHGQTRNARSMGHELLIHTPMEPMNGKADPGPGALLDDMSAEQIAAKLEVILDSFDGYVGINNHMGSKLTQNSEVMVQVMDVLAGRGLAFVDSKTIRSSVAGEVARAAGLAVAERDVFLDHEETPEFVRAALARVEMLALRDGTAIAIGHPKDVTLEALAEWLPSLREKGLVLAPVSAVFK